LAADALISMGCQLAPLTQASLEALNQLLPPHWSHGNPVDTLGDANADRYVKAVEIASKDPNSDGVLAILAPLGLAEPTEAAQKLTRLAKLDGKPILASWMGGEQVAPGNAILSRANIPIFSYPDTAVRAFRHMWRYSYNLRGLYETPRAVSDTAGSAAGSSEARSLIDRVRKAGRTILTELESKKLLGDYGMPVVQTASGSSEKEAAALAAQIGYPVVLKLLSETVTHKSDVDGVHLNLASDAAVRSAYRAIEASARAKAGADSFLGVTVQPMVKLEGYEIIVGSSTDPQFGPVILFGAGGQLVEVFKDRSLALPPLNTTLARRMMEQTRIFRALQGARGRRPVDLAALEHLMVRLSQLVLELRAIKEIDINPLLVSPGGMVALDARVVLHDPGISEEELPRPAIRPYPSKYVAPWTLKNATPVTIRPIGPEDEPLMVKFHQALSERSVYMRYLHTMSLDFRVAHERLTRICFIDYDREMVLVAEHRTTESGAGEIIAVGRLTRLPGTSEAEAAILVRDSFQRQGLGKELLCRLVEFGREERIQRIRAETLAENFEMQHICTNLGFRLDFAMASGTVRAILDL